MCLHCSDNADGAAEPEFQNEEALPACPRQQIVYPSKWTDEQILAHGGKRAVHAHIKVDEDDSSSDEDDTEHADETTNLAHLQAREEGSIFTFKTGTRTGSDSKPTTYFVFKTILERKDDVSESDELIFVKDGEDCDARIQARQAETTKRALTRLCEMRESPSFYIAVILMQAGSFVGTIFDRNDPIRHKVFRRYTTRRKQGGSQSSYDNSGSGRAQSAGANLRRANEQALANEIKALLLSWKDDLLRCSHIYMQVNLRHAMFFTWIFRMIASTQCAPSISLQNCFSPFQCLTSKFIIGFLHFYI